ncbi:hypothetical protein [Nitrosospira multiformis]|nr:hypothetical protein [Nitrosospira multiformis]
MWLKFVVTAHLPDIRMMSVEGFTITGANKKEKSRLSARNSGQAAFYDR